MSYIRGRASIKSSYLPIASTVLAFLSGCAKTLPIYEPTSPIKSEAYLSVVRSNLANIPPITQDQACEATGLALLKGIKDNHKLGYELENGAFTLTTDRSVISIYTAPLKSCDTFLEYVDSLNNKLQPMLQRELLENPVSQYSFEANPEILNLFNLENKLEQHLSAARLESLCLGENTQGKITVLDEFAQYLYILNTLSPTESNGHIYLAGPKDQLNEIVQRRWNEKP